MPKKLTQNQIAAIVGLALGVVILGIAIGVILIATHPKDKKSVAKENQAKQPEKVYAGLITSFEYAGAYEADGSNEAALKAKYVGNLWLIHLTLGNRKITEDRLEMSHHPNWQWVTVKYNFDDLGELAQIDDRDDLLIEGINNRKFVFDHCRIVRKSRRSSAEHSWRLVDGKIVDVKLVKGQWVAEDDQ